MIARDAAAHSHRDMITEGVTVKPMIYEELLTASQHEQLIKKVCTFLKQLMQKVRHGTDLIATSGWHCNPKEQQWISARQIIQHWDLTMRT